MHIKGYFMSKNSFVAEVTFKWSRFFIVITFQNKNEMITLFWWLFLPNIFTKPFIKLKKEDISTCIYKLCNENWKYLELKPKLLKAEFFINIMIRFEKKKKNKMITAGWWYRRSSLGFEVSNTRSNNLPQ